MASVFISYSMEDIEFAKKMARFLEENGYEVWMDKKRIWVGANYVKEIANGIGRADIFMPLISKKSICSRWVERELYYALGKDKKIFPVLVEVTELPEELELILGHIQHLDFAKQTENQNPWQELEAALSKFFSPVAKAGPAAEEKQAYKELHNYLSIKTDRPIRVRPITLLVAAIAVMLAVFSGYFLISGKSSLLQPDKIQFSELAPDINEVLKMAYTTPLKQTDIQAAAAIFTGKKNEPVGRWMLLRNGQELSSDDRYFITMRSNQICYLYVFQIDSTGKLDWVFPANSFSKDSSGRNPVPAKNLVKAPPEDKAFYLDESLGVEHLYVVATPGPWPELEAALSKAAQAKPFGKPLLASLNIKTRGVAGTESVDFGPALLGQMTSGETQHYFKGIQGALVVDFWFKHVATKKNQ